MASVTTDRRLGLNGSQAIKVPCKAGTTSAITLSGEQTVDGVSCVDGDRVLVKSQSSSVDNGIYVCDSGAWTRDLDFDGANDVVTGTIVFVVNGTANANTYWRVTTTGTISFGSSAITFASALASDSSFLNFLQAGTGAVARTAQAKMQDIFSVKDFGAVGDGTTDDSAAILAAVNAAAASASGAHNSRAGVFFPAGIYKVTTSACFTPTGFTSIPGVHFYGDGWYTSIIRYGTLSGSTWLYDNGATSRMQFATFCDLGFEGMDPASFSFYTDIPANANGFKITSAGNEQGFKFERCQFGYFATAFDMEGTNTASEMKFVNCKFHHIKTTVYKVNNLQSVNHEFYSCDVEVIYGDVFSVAAAGGGAIKVYGGSWILFSDTGADTYFFRGVGVTGIAASPFVFDGMRFELRGNNSNLVSLTTLKQFALTFDKCLLEDQATSDKANWVTVGCFSSVYFKNCQFYETVADHIKFVIANSAAMVGINGEIIFEACQLPIDFSDKCSATNNYGTGLISARNCFGSNIGATGDAPHWAHDFDLHWNATAGQVGTWAPSGATLKDSGSPSHPQWVLKTAQIKLNTDFWPDTTETTLKLPKNAILKNLHLRKPPHASEATSVTLRIGRNDKSGTDHLTVTANWNAAHSADVTSYFYHVGSTTNERTLRLYTNENPTGVVQGGLCIVEYY